MSRTSFSSAVKPSLLRCTGQIWLIWSQRSETVGGWALPLQAWTHVTVAFFFWHFCTSYKIWLLAISFLDSLPARRSVKCLDYNPCEEGGVCVFSSQRGRSTCSCRKGLHGTLCEKGQHLFKPNNYKDSTPGFFFTKICSISVDPLRLITPQRLRSSPPDPMHQNVNVEFDLGMVREDVVLWHATWQQCCKWSSLRVFSGDTKTTATTGTTMTIEGKLHSKTISSDMIFRGIRWWRSEVKIRTEIETVKQTAKEMARASVCNVTVPPRNHARSREWFEMFMTSRNHFLPDLP